MMPCTGVTLEDSYRYCARVSRQQARNFYYAFLVMPREKRRAFCAVYAFLRHSDDISDEGSPAGRGERRHMLQQWRARLAAALEGDYGDSRLLPAFHATVRRFSIPPRYFYELIDGGEMDLGDVRFRTFEDLYLYCYRVAGVVGLVSLHVFGFPPEHCAEAMRRAEACGIAFQLTNILRDLREDAALGRTYLPEQDLARFGYSSEKLRQGIGGEDYRQLMEFEAGRAANYYREALPLLELISPDCRPALWAMIRLYGGILARMRAANFPMLRRRVELSTMEKLDIAARALWLRVAGRAAFPSPVPTLG
jgi:phytoene synthase